MTPRIRFLVLAGLIGLLFAVPGFAQLTLRGDYVAARGITELGALYAKETKTTVSVTPFSTNSGIEGVLNGQIDVAVAARSPVAARQAEHELIFWPVVWDALVFIVHPSNPVTDLSLVQVRDIFQGKLENWSEVGGKDAPIDLYSVMGPYDGLESSIRTMLFADPGYRAKIDRLFLNQHQIEIGIQMDPDAIGMTTLAGLSQQKVKALSIEGVAADEDSIGDGSYLLTLPLYLVYRADGPKTEEINQFAEFLRTPIAENVIRGKRLVPHSEDEAFRTMHMQRLATMWERLGGQPVPSGQVRLLAQADDPAAVVEADADGVDDGEPETGAAGEVVSGADEAVAGTAAADEAVELVAEAVAETTAGEAAAEVAVDAATAEAVAEVTADATVDETATESAVASTSVEPVATDVGAADDVGDGEPNGDSDCKKRLFARNKC